MTKPPKIFWSWQSDVSPSCCRNFIQSALAEAIKASGKDMGLEDAERPGMDHATKDTAGMVDIAATIFEKISSAAIFVADVTPLTTLKRKKALPNPNVLVELGWALQKPGIERVIAVMNTAPNHKIEQMPFDIRQRRILTYKLSEDDDKKTRKEVKKKLIGELTEAIKKNLGSHLETKAKTATIVSSPAKENDRSLWVSAEETISMTDTFSQTSKSIKLVTGPRGYIRIIPSGWKNYPPTIKQMESVQQDMNMWPKNDLCGGGDYGVTKEGFIHYWSRNCGAGIPEVENLSYYFDQTGEIWMLHGNAIGHGNGNSQRLLRPAALIGGWSIALRKSFKIFEQFLATDPFKVEVGLSNMDGVLYLDDTSMKKPVARSNDFHFERQHQVWTHDQQIEFLFTAYKRMTNLFAVDFWDQKQFLQHLEYWDAGRFQNSLNDAL